MNYRPNLNNIQSRSQQLERKRWCSKHGWRAYWGINPQTDDFYSRCVEGNKRDEDCVIGE